MLNFSAADGARRYLSTKKEKTIRNRKKGKNRGNHDINTHSLYPHTRWYRTRRSRLSSANTNSRNIISRTSLVCHIIHQYDSSRNTVLKDRITRRQLCIGRSPRAVSARPTSVDVEVRYARLVGWTESFGDEEGWVESWADCPLTEGGLVRCGGCERLQQYFISWHFTFILKKRTHVIKITLPTNVQKRVREPIRSHAQRIIRHPQRGYETITQPWEPTTRGCVRFEHDERFVVLCCDLRGIEVWIWETFDTVVVEVDTCEECIWVDGGTRTVAVVLRVARKGD